MEPLPKEKRHSADYRDEIEHAEVAAALSELPEDHPAAVAYLTGTLGDSLALTLLLKDRPDIAQRLVSAYLNHNARIMEKRGGAHLAAKPS